MAVGYLRGNGPYGPFWARPKQVAIRAGGQWKVTKEAYIRHNGSWLHWWGYAINADIQQVKTDGDTGTSAFRAFTGSVNSPYTGQYYLTIEVQHPGTGEWTNSNNNWALTTTGGIFRGETQSIANGAINGNAVGNNLPYRAPIQLTERVPMGWSSVGGTNVPKSKISIRRTLGAPWRLVLQVRVAIDDGINTWHSAPLTNSAGNTGITWSNY